MTRKAGRRAGMLAILTTLALVLTSATAFAKGKPTTEATNNLSVPAYVVTGTNASKLTIPVCPGGPTNPTGTTAVYDGVTYFIQGQATWQAQCRTADSNTLNVSAAWGDNLTGAVLKAGTPIRVEIGLLHTLTAPDTMTGYQVLNLTSVLDRTDTYGTTGEQVTFSEVRAYDPDATLTITNDATGAPVTSGLASAEINATGAIVYGYNWGSGSGSKSTVTEGKYTITFTAPNVVMTGADAGTISADGHTVTLGVTVNAKTSGQGGGGGHRG